MSVSSLLSPRTIENSSKYLPTKMTDLSSDKVDLSDNTAVVTVITHLRAAWRHSPSPIEQKQAAEFPGVDGTCWPVTEFMKEHSGTVDSQGRPISTETEGEEIYQSEPLDTEPDTPWRRGVYHIFNHVFWDASHSLEKLGAELGHLHPPSESHLTVHYGETLRTVWQDNALVMPIYLGDEVAIKGAFAYSNSKSELDESATIGSFHADNPFELWCIHAGETVMFTTKRTSKSRLRRGEVAAVLLVGTLCTLDHSKP